MSQAQQNWSLWGSQCPRSWAECVMPWVDVAWCGLQEVIFQGHRWRFMRHRWSMNRPDQQLDICRIEIENDGKQAVRHLGLSQNRVSYRDIPFGSFWFITTFLVEWPGAFGIDSTSFSTEVRAPLFDEWCSICEGRPQHHSLLTSPSRPEIESPQKTRSLGRSRLC